MCIQAPREHSFGACNKGGSRMKNLVVYYSLEGNTQYVVDKIKEQIGADTLRLVPKKAYHDKGLAKFLWGGKSAMMAEKPELEAYEVDLSAYDRVIFGFPVWASNFTPPLRTFIEDHAAQLQGKHFAAFACQTGAGGEKALEKLAKSVGIARFEQKAIFLDPKAKQSAQKDEQIRAFCARLAE